MLVLLLTFLCYTSYHASRKPPSIVKSVLHGEGAGAGLAAEFGRLGGADPGGAGDGGRAFYDYHWAAAHHGEQRCCCRVWVVAVG